MIHKIIREEIRVPGTLEDTYLETYLLSVTDKFTVQERPLILICPGGGYNHTSDREAEIVAMQFNAMGYHTAVLRYSSWAITRLSCDIPVLRLCFLQRFWN